MISLKKTVELRETEDGAILLDTSRGGYWHLNELGTALVCAIRDGITVDEFVASTVEAYAVDFQTVQRDVNNILAELKKARLVRGRAQ